MIDRACRALLELFLRRITTGSLTVLEADGRRVYGSGAPTATLRVHSSRTWRDALRGSRGLADAYTAGLWDSPDLTALVRLAARNVSGLDRLRARLAPVRVPFQLLRAWLRRSTRLRRRRDIAAHYDLGNQLFSRMLDPTMSYSCAFFEDPGMTLEEAQLAKLEMVCEKLELGPGDRLLEIGTGWGGLAIHAAITRGCHVTTTTISREQYDHVASAVRRAPAAWRGGRSRSSKGVGPSCCRVGSASSSPRRSPVSPRSSSSVCASSDRECTARATR